MITRSTAICQLRAALPVPSTIIRAHPRIAARAAIRIDEDNARVYRLIVKALPHRRRGMR